MAASAAAVAQFDAVILAGGRAARLAGADKPSLDVGGVPMLVSVARAAVTAGARKLIIVGPDRAGRVHDALASVAADLPGLPSLAGSAGLPGLPAGLSFVREEPPGGGPVPALRRGLAEVTAPWLALLAADLPFLTGLQLSDLLERAGLVGGRGAGIGEARGAGVGEGGGEGDADGGGAVLADDAGWPQWLAGCWQANALRAATARYQGNSLHGLLAPLSPQLARPAAIGGAPPPWLDCDTADDLAAARAIAPVRGRDRGR